MRSQILVQIRQPWWSGFWFRLLAPLVGTAMGATIVILSHNGFNVRTLGAALAVLVGTVAVLSVPGLKRLLLLGIALDLSLGVDVNFGCNEAFFSTACGISFSITTLFLLVLYAGWLLEGLRGLKRPPDQRFSLGAVGTASLIFLVAAVVSLLNAAIIRYGINQIWLYASATLLAIYIANNLRSADDVLVMVYGLALGLFIQTIVMSMQIAGIVEVKYIGDSADRIYGTLRHPNIAGGYLFQVVLLLIGARLIKKDRWHARILTVMIIAGATMLVFTQSRGSWLALLVGLAVIIIGGLWSGRLTLRFVAQFGLVVLLLALPLSSTVVERLTSDDRGAALARVPLQDIAFSMIEEQPWIGVGINNFGVVLYDYLGPDQYGTWLFLVHNGWLLIWAEMGTFGLIAFASLWLIAGRQALMLLRSHHETYSMLGLAILAILCGLGLYMMTQVSIRRELIFLLWTYFGLLEAMMRLHRQESRQTYSLNTTVQVSTQYGKPARSYQ